MPHPIYFLSHCCFPFKKSHSCPPYVLLSRRDSHHAPIHPLAPLVPLAHSSHPLIQRLSPQCLKTCYKAWKRHIFSTIGKYFVKCGKKNIEMFVFPNIRYIFARKSMTKLLSWRRRGIPKLVHNGISMNETNPLKRPICSKKCMKRRHFKVFLKKNRKKKENFFVFGKFILYFAAWNVPCLQIWNLKKI